MTIRLGDTAPDFEAVTTEGPIRFHEWLSEGWGILFSHPKDFTPVCTTELGEAAKLAAEFARRDVKVMGDLYDMVHPNADDTMTVRSVFVIGPDKKVKLTLTYPASTGRNFDEILRVIDSLQLTHYCQVATPVNWRLGEDVVIAPALTDDEARSKFPAGWTELKPYLRITPQPALAR